MSIARVPAAQVSTLALSGVAPDMLAFVPRHERAMYAQLRNAAKDDLRAKLRALAALIAEGKKPRDLTRRLAAAAKALGISAPQGRRLWDAWWLQGWRGLINRSLAGPEWQERRDGAHQGIFNRPAFIEFVRLTFEGNQRGSKAAYVYVLKPRLARWRATLDPKWAIPGYDTPPPDAEGFDHPLGWSYDNLMEHGSSRFELLASRIGRDAAYEERPMVYSSRVGLWVGSHYMMDDMWHDFFVNSLAEMQAGRPLELFTHDYYSGRKVRWGVRVRTKGDDGKYKGIEERMARFILAATLYLDGYSPRGTVVVIEHGTATIPPAMRTALYELSGGLISFSLSGMQGAAAHGGQYPGLRRGNPRHKASLESSNNLTHNAFAALPGQTGKDVASRPEGLGAMLKENDTYLQAYAALPPSRAALLEFPLLELGKFHAVAHDIYRAIENNPDHKLGDWAECGHLVEQAWIEGQWRDIPAMDTLSETARAALLAGLEDGTLRTRTRHMTRGEVWDRGAGELIRLPGHGVWELLQADLGSPRRVAANELAFEDQEVGPGKLRFHARGVGVDGEAVSLRDRETYHVVVNPFAPETAFVGDVDGRYIGEFAAIVRVTRTTETRPFDERDDTPSEVPPDAANLRAMGVVARTEAELLTPLRERHAGEAAAKVSRQRRNAALLDVSKPATREERAAAKQSQKLAAMAEAALARRSSATGTTEPPTAQSAVTTTRPAGTNQHEPYIITTTPGEQELYDPFAA